MHRKNSLTSRRAWILGQRQQRHKPSQADIKIILAYWMKSAAPSPEDANCRSHPLLEFPVRLMGDREAGLRKRYRHWMRALLHGLLGHEHPAISNPHVRTFVWEQVKDNYYKKGVRVFWLDEA